MVNYLMGIIQAVVAGFVLISAAVLNWRVKCKICDGYLIEKWKERK